MIPPMWAAGAVAAQLVATRLAGGRRRFSGQRPAAVLVATASMGLAASGFAALLCERTTVHPTHTHLSTSLVTHGVYGRTRNPLYLSFLVAAVAVSVNTGRARTLVAVPALAAALTPQILREEKALAGLFGDDFRSYAARVPRWL